MDIEGYKKDIIALLKNTKDHKLYTEDIIKYFTDNTSDQSMIIEKEVKKAIDNLKKDKSIKVEGKVKEGNQMCSIKPWSYNKGEWSELYTFAYLLSNPKMYSADKDLNAMEEVYFPVLEIIRQEDKKHPIYYKTGDIIQVYQDGKIITEVERTEFENIAKRLLKYIPKGSRAFEIDGVEDFFNKIYCTKVKAQSDQKEDITIETQDIYTGIKAVRGFSIKSYLGSNPTLVNPGENTNFVFLVKECNDQIVYGCNSINSRTKIKDRMEYINSHCILQPLPNSLSTQFSENLQFIDSFMPYILHYMVLYSYQRGITKVSEVVDLLKRKNPLYYRNTEMYTYKIKKLLCAWALGMTPERSDWLGSEDANGGYITVKHDGSVVCYHLYNRKEFEDYLFEYTYFDRPSTTRYNYLKIYKEGKHYKIKLNLQIRFKNPASK